MKRILVSALALLLLTLCFAGCGKRVKEIDVPKELQINPRSLSEDADNLMPIDDKTPLMAAIPERGLYIYYTDRTVKSGVLVKYDGLLQFFPWRFTPELARPDVYIADYNGDGKEDIALTVVSETGRTTACENLYLLLRGEKQFEDFLYTGEKAAIQCRNHLIGYQTEKDQYTVYLDGEPQTFILPGHTNFVGLYYKYKQDFTLGDTITVELEPGLEFANESDAVYSVLGYTARLEVREGDVFQVDPQLTISAERVETP